MLIKTYKPVLVVVILLSLFLSCKKDKTLTPPPPPGIVIKPPPAFGYYVVGYFPSYRNIADVPDVKFRMCNVINYAFFGVDAGGLRTVNNTTTLTAVLTAARPNNA